jgi:CRP-like cAMP-binding protein
MYPLLRQQIEKITPLTDGEFAQVAGYFAYRKLRKHQFLVEAGNLVEREFFVLSGCLKAYYPDNGKDHILQFALPDWWVTDYAAFFGQTKATIYIDCLEESEVLGITLADKEKLCAELPKIEHFFRKKSNAGYVALQRRILSLLTSTAKERYEQLLQLYPQLFQKVPKTLIAAYLGVSRETLSRLHSAKK